MTLTPDFNPDLAVYIGLGLLLAALVLAGWDHHSFLRETQARRRERRDLATPRYTQVCDPAAEAGSSKTPKAAPALQPDDDLIHDLQSVDNLAHFPTSTTLNLAPRFPSLLS